MWSIPPNTSLSHTKKYHWVGRKTYKGKRQNKPKLALRLTLESLGQKWKCHPGCSYPADELPLVNMITERVAVVTFRIIYLFIIFLWELWTWEQKQLYLLPRRIIYWLMFHFIYKLTEERISNVMIDASNLSHTYLKEI